MHSAAIKGKLFDYWNLKLDENKMEGFRVEVEKEIFYYQ
jgi:hypothetical protein